MIEILTSGATNTIQDTGRRGLLEIGVGRCGAMDLPSFRAGNILLGNDPDAAGIEVSFFPFRLRLHGSVAIAVMGADCRAELAGRSLPPCWALRADAGSELTLSPPRAGARANLLFAGGLDTPVVLGSRSTDLKAGFGGIAGRGLKRGDRIPVAAAAPVALPEGGLGALPYPDDAGMAPRDGRAIELRLLPAAEYASFTDASIAAFHAQPWTITPDADRMGYRLAGPTLEFRERRELFSHGIVPGTVQVPPSGQPIIQLADANTCGGYPKIGVVVGADLWRLAQAPVGATLVFRRCERAEAVEATRRQRDHLRRIASFADLMRSQ